MISHDIFLDIFLKLRGKKVKQSNGLATDGERDLSGRSLPGLKGETAEMPLLRGSRLPPARTSLSARRKSSIQEEIKPKARSRAVRPSWHERVSESTAIKAKQSLGSVTIQARPRGAGHGDADAGSRHGHRGAGP